MKICVLGWYGTETIGDRAIFAGLISIFNKTYSSYEITLGSLCPFYTENTIFEDNSFYNELTCTDVKITVFDSTKIGELNRIIKKTDLVVIGGGPLMDISPMFMIEYAFKYALKHGKKTAILGCGIGPLYNAKYINSFKNIIRLSNLIILRDSYSIKYMDQFMISGKDKELVNKVKIGYDPAIESLVKYKIMNSKKMECLDEIIVNLREFPNEYLRNNTIKNLDSFFIDMIKWLIANNENKIIKLVPMHYSVNGGDDRVLLNRLSILLNEKRVEVQNTPLSLKETFKLFSTASVCLGMRYHSVVFQTILNGNNYVIDYTEPKLGKISAFLHDVNVEDFYKDRYLNLQEMNTDSIPFNLRNKKCVLDLNFADKYLIQYEDELRKVDA